MADFTMKRHDTRPYLRATLESNGAAYNLTGATVQFMMKLADGTGGLKVDAAATVVDAVTGIVEYRWTALDTDTAGDWIGEFEVTDSGGKILTFPNGAGAADYFTIDINEDLG